MADQRVVEISRMIDATPEAVFRALTHPLELTYWFSHLAWTDPKVGGDFEVRWRNGWWARGVYRMLERPGRIELTWQGKDEPYETNLVFEIKAQEQGTLVRVIHSGYGEDAVWDKAVSEAESSWPLSLENLESVLTTGIDLREASRPLLGIVPEELTAERAVKEGIGVEHGIYLTGVLDDGGAAEAGLQKGDVITSIGGMAVFDQDSLTTTLSRYRAGERTHVRYVRGRGQGTAIVELKQRPIPEISFDPQEVVAQVREEQAAVMTELRQALDGLTEEDAGERPAPGEWSVKETLAHLSHNERATQQWFCDIIVGTTPGQSGGNPTVVPEIFGMVFAAAPTVEKLVARLEQDMEETLALFGALRPQIVAMKARYRQMASYLHYWSFHTREHLEQMKAAIEAVRGQG
jgi:uncharacterized protein YndB with AHSA1/START domain